MPIAVTFANALTPPLPDDPYRTRPDRGDRDDREATPSRPARLPGCAHCGAQLLTAEQAATLCQSNRRLIYRWVEQGSLDYHEAADGAVLVCSRSLLAQVERLEDATARFNAPIQS